jgi:sporulation protein YlmC with PRC-barrel domain
MTRPLIYLVAAMASATMLGAALPAYAQPAPQTLVNVNPQSLASGYRVSKIVGSTVVNRSNEKVGIVDDLIVTPNERVPFAILSVGGFLGIGTKYVALPYSALEMKGDKILLPNATKANLKTLPAFTYTS